MFNYNISIQLLHEQIYKILQHKIMAISFVFWANCRSKISFPHTDIFIYLTIRYIYISDGQMYLSVWWSDGYFCLKCSMLEKTQSGSPVKPALVTLKYVINHFCAAAMRKFVSTYAVILVFTCPLYATFFCKQIIGSSKPYCLLRCQTWKDHECLFLQLFSNRYLMGSLIFLPGCD